MRLHLVIALLAVGLGMGLRLPAAEPDEGKVDIDALMAGWEKAVRAQIARDPELTALAAKYRLVLLHAQRYLDRGYKHGRTHYNFIHASSDDDVTGGTAHVVYLGGDRGTSFEVVRDSRQQNLVADLGAVDFTRDPDPKKVDIDGAGQSTWVGACKAIPGHVYLERVRDWDGHLFYVLLKVVAADEKQGRYMAFLWRRLPEPPGVKRPKPVEPYPDQYKPPFSAAELAKVDQRMAEWGKAVREKMLKDPTLTVLAVKYPLVLLHSRHYSKGGAYDRSAYSFIYRTSDQKKYHNDVQIGFEPSGTCPDFTLHNSLDRQNLVADLGQVDFTKDADPRQVDLDGAGQYTWLADYCAAVEGHVYLERVKNIDGTHFFVQFLVVAVDPDNRYMAFVWRRLPGGKVVEPPGSNR
jgi:hypothetical protein